MTYSPAFPQRFLMRLPLLLGVTLAVVAIAGCEPTEIRPQQPKYPEPTSINANELAHRLHMTITSSSGSMVSMRSIGNSVVLYADPCGQAYVNGRAVGESGGFTMASDTLYVPIELEPIIRRSLRDAPGPEIKPQPLNLHVDPRTGNAAKAAKVAGKVVIDPGHGGGDPGTNPGAAKCEKTINLAVGNKVVEILRERGVTVKETRSEDRALDPVKETDLEMRIDKANNMGADLFVALHCDYTRSTLIEGHTVITPRTYSSKANVAANFVSQRMREAGSPKHGVRADERGLRVLERAKVPAILVEMGFLSNRDDAARLCDANGEQKLAEAIADGICDYLRAK